MMICPKAENTMYANWSCPHSKPHKYSAKNCGGSEHCPPCKPLPDKSEVKK